MLDSLAPHLRMPAPASSTDRVQFGVFELDLQNAELRKGGVKVKLQEQPLKILQILLENPGRIVGREELQKRVWPANTFVEFDQGLYSAMARLRDALGDSSDNPRFIETAARRGYRFIAPVTSLAAGPTSDTAPEKNITTETNPPFGVRRFVLNLLAGLVGGALLLAIALEFNIADAREWLRSRTTPIRSIAVLPLQNLSNDPEQEYFADGMTDELITSLAMLKDVRVISRTSVMRYKGTTKAMPQIGHELHVDAIVEGSVLRSGGRVRITAQLVEASTDRHLWAASYDRELRDTLLTQAEAARSITENIRAQLTMPQKEKLAKTRTVNPEAYDLYLRARWYSERITHADTAKCIETLQLSIKKDPSFADAYTALADCYDFGALVGLLSEADATARMRNALARALELDDGQAEAHALLCRLDTEDWNWESAEHECRRALELGPNLPAAHDQYSDLLLITGNLEGSVKEMRLAAELDPLSPRQAAGIGWQLIYARHYDEAIQQFQQVLSNDPNYVVAHTGLERAYQIQGNYGASISETKWIFIEQGFTDKEAEPRIAELRTAYRSSGPQGYWKKHLEWDAEDVWEKKIAPGQHVPALFLALDYANLGQIDRAFLFLKQAGQQHEAELAGRVAVDPRFDSLRSDPRFEEILKQVGLTQSLRHSTGLVQ
jgi:TolB-like protein/DNA-binding winged helix-turn-helix (wHTH) protein